MPVVNGRLEALPLAQRPAALDRAALDACLADAFHPGCEVTWPIRHASMWQEPYRLKVRAGSEPDYGASLTPARAAAIDGPLAGSFPGSLTRWMAVPWQTDTVNCRSGYQPSIDQFLDTFWPARVPNQVLSAADYATVMNTALPLGRTPDRLRAAQVMAALDDQARLPRDPGGDGRALAEPGARGGGAGAL